MNDLPYPIRREMRIMLANLDTKEPAEIDSIVSITVFDYLELSLLPDISEKSLQPTMSAHLFAGKYDEEQEKYVKEIIDESFNIPGVKEAFDFKPYKILTDDKNDNIVGILVESNMSGMKFILAERLNLENKDEDIITFRLSFAKLLKFMNANKIH